MLEFLQNNWQLIVALVLAVVNFIVTLAVHAKSSSKIAAGATAQENTAASVAEALLSVVALSKELINEIDNQKKKTGSEEIQQNG